jgi:Sec-independent protein translocase protein TatA
VNFFGMGSMEVLIVLLVAFIFLGPQRMLDAARFLGKLVGEVRRLTADLPDLVIDEDEVRTTRSPTVNRGAGPKPARVAETTPDRTPSKSDTDPVNEDGPVAFNSAADPRSRRDAEPPQGPDIA